MLLNFTYKHDLVCWSLAIALHTLLLLIHIDIMQETIQSDLIPIVEIEYVVAPSMAAAPPIVRQKKNIISKIKDFFSVSKEPAGGREELATGKIETKIDEPVVKKTEQERLRDKGKLIATAKMEKDFEPVTSENISDTFSTKIKETGFEPSVAPSDKVDVLKDRTYQVAKKELPFEISNRDQIQDKTYDRVFIDVGDKTSKNIEAKPLQDKNVWQSKDSSMLSGPIGGGGDELSGVDKGAFGGGTIRTVGEPSYGTGEGSGGGGLAEGKGTGIGSGSGTGTGTGTGYSGVPGGLGTSGKGFPWAGPTSGSGSGTGTGSGVGLREGTASSTKKSRSAIYEISGPLSNRKILKKVLPEYPEWAQKQGLEFSCTLLFYVLSDGIVKDNIVIHKSSGDVRIDKSAIQALNQWEFVALPRDQYGEEQWGYITFNFSFRF